MLREVVTHQAGIATVRLSPDGLRLLSGARGGMARIWPTRERELLALARRRASRELTPEQAAMLRAYLDR